MADLGLRAQGRRRRSWGARFHPGLQLVQTSDQVLKGVNGEDGYSAFSVRASSEDEPAPTELRELLSRRGIERIVVAGLATDYCVKETALDGLRLGFRDRPGFRRGRREPSGSAMASRHWQRLKRRAEDRIRLV